MYTLVVCEKPDAARRIAQALGQARESRPSGVPVFDVVAADSNRYVVCSASGHLYGLTDAAAAVAGSGSAGKAGSRGSSSRSVYPVLDLEWAPLGADSNPRAGRIIKVISGLARGASAFVHACDYDQEGEVIGYSILEYACGGVYGRSLRTKFSTLTDEEVRASFAGLASPSAGLAEAGRARHMLDFIYGVNLSRALAGSFKAGNKKSGYRNLSMGRVQGPALAFVVDREREVRLHVPDPYWTVTAELEKKGEGGEAEGGRRFTAHYEKPRIGILAEARSVVRECEGRPGNVTGVGSRKVVFRPPPPFNTGDLQKEAYRVLRLSPGYTLAIAERLYLQALISYPRTSSQKLPPSIGYRKIISSLAQAGSYGRLASMLLSRGRLVPSEGVKADPAHPAIYPTGVAPRKVLGGLEFKVYDLIVKRFLATFGDPAAAVHTEVSVEINGHAFRAEGRTTTYEGWTALYRPYVALEQSELPALQKGEMVGNNGVEMQEKFTQPPYRYSQASLLAKMEEEQIGTKATRADVIATLFKRNYVASHSSSPFAGGRKVKGGAAGTAATAMIEATDLGFAVVESMRGFAPAIVSTALTQSMEEQLEGVELGSASSASVIEYAVDRLVESLAAFRGSELEIRRQIGDAAASDSATAATAAAIGMCPVCKEGRLRIVRSRTSKKRFVGCSNYFLKDGSSSKEGAAAGGERGGEGEKGCRATAPLPQKGSVKATGKSCRECGWPTVKVVFARRAKPWMLCVNVQCPSKEKKEKKKEK